MIALRWVFFIGFFVSPFSGLAQTDYGELFFDDRIEERSPFVRLSASFYNEFDNAYQYVAGVRGLIEFRVSDDFYLGYAHYFYDVENSDSAKKAMWALSRQNQVYAIDTVRSSQYVVATYLPFAGQMNLKSFGVLPFDIAVVVGAGRSEFEWRGFENSALWNLSLRFPLWQYVDLTMGGGQQVEGLFEAETRARNELFAGVSGRF